MREFKVGDLVIFIDKIESDEWSFAWEKGNTNFLYKEIGTIIDIKTWGRPYLVEFKKYINGHSGFGNGKKGHCFWCKKYEIKLAINHLKFKKWIKG